MSSFDQRLIFQKKVYLIQEMGIDLGYSFGWYLRGPYSSVAASEGFELAIREIDECEIDSEEEEILDSFEEMIEDIDTAFEGKELGYVLELLASLHFIVKHGYPKRSLEEAVKHLAEVKPKFRDDVELAQKFLQEHGLV